MNFEIKRKKAVALLICGILGCILLAASDYLMIYGDTAYTGSLAWLTLGAAEIPAGRNVLAMVCAFPAVLLYAPGLFVLRYFIFSPRERRNYSGLTAVGMTPWLCLHLFYIMILFAFGFLMQSGEEETAYLLCEAMFGHFSWLVILGELIMLMPFVYLFILILRGRTVFKKLMALNNPLIIYIVLKLISSLMPDVPFRLAFVNGLMSEAMLISFIIFIFALPGTEKSKE